MGINKDVIRIVNLITKGLRLKSCAQIATGGNHQKL